MRHFSTIAIAALAALFLTIAPAHAEKFKNIDTAKDRKDNVFGTDQREDGTAITIEKKNGPTVIRSKSIPKEEKDWYDTIDIEVEPQVNWPKDSTTSTTTTETTVDPVGDTTTKTTTTETKVE